MFGAGRLFHTHLWPRAEGETLAHNERSASVEEQAHIGIIKGSAKRGSYTKGTASLDHEQADVLVDHRKQETRRVEQEEENGSQESGLAAVYGLRVTYV